MERPHVLKRLYVAIFCIVATAFLTVAAATYWWWLDVEIALVAFFCLGVFPVAFYTLLGTTVMDPGKTEGGGLIDRKSARFVDRFGRALMPLVIFTAIFGGLLASWWFPSVRKVVLQQTTALGFDIAAYSAIHDVSPDVALAACEFLQETGSAQPFMSLQAHVEREAQDGPDVLDCLVSLPGSRFEVAVAASRWHEELEGEPSDDRACRLTNRIRFIAEREPDPAQMWLLEFAVSGGTPATKACASQAIGALARANQVDPALILPTAERVSRSALRHHADTFLLASFDPDSREPLVEFAAWDAVAQKEWSLEVACESLNATRDRLIDKKLDHYLATSCGFEESDRVFERMCNQTVEGVEPLDLCGRVAQARKDLAFIEARGIVRAGMTQDISDRLLRRILEGAGVLKEDEGDLYDREFNAKKGRKVTLNTSAESISIVQGIQEGKLSKRQMGALMDVFSGFIQMRQERDEALQDHKANDKRD